MFAVKTTSLISLLIIVCECTETKSQRPNIIFFLADDLGWNDVGYHGSSEIPTPNIDALAYNGIRMEKHYAQGSCTPSRAALLTGDYPIRHGYQSFPLFSGETRRMPPETKTLPKELKKLGYKTHLVGKWHLGMAAANSTPTGLGYDTHFGYWNGFISYFDHIKTEDEFNFRGTDLHDGLVPVLNESGNYFTDLITRKTLQIIDNHNVREPIYLSIHHLASHTGKLIEGDGVLEVPNVSVTNIKYKYIADPKRRLYADVTEIMDNSIGLTIKKLKEKGMLENSIVIFCSDNGAPTEEMFSNAGSNFPFKGMKMSQFEGAIRVPAVIYSPFLQEKGSIFNQLFHISDWAPTLYSAAGGDSKVFENNDGIDQWDNICLNKKLHLRKELLVDLSERFDSYSVIGYDGRYKLINGTIKNTVAQTKYSGTAGQAIPGYLNTVVESMTNQAIAQLENKQPLTVDQMSTRMQNSIHINCRPNNHEDIEDCKGVCLYDLIEDPCETTNLKDSYPDIVDVLMNKLTDYKRQALSENIGLVDLRSDPSMCNDTWWPFLDGVEGCYFNDVRLKQTSHSAGSVPPILKIMETCMIWMFATFIFFYIYKKTLILYRHR